jgi:HK97 family phage portal protein
VALLARILALSADAGSGQVLPPDADMWYHGIGYHTATGLKISPESALRVAAVFACIRVRAETLGSLPGIIYRRKPDGSKERASDHPLYKVLHDRPNALQTSMDFVQMMQAHLDLRGNAFARIVPGPRGAIDQLIPLHPDRVRVFRLPNGRLRYQVMTFYSADIETLSQEEVLHLRGLSSDGVSGMSTIAAGAEVVACALAAQEYAGRFFENDATPPGTLSHPKSLTEDAYNRIKKSWHESHSGHNAHSVALLEEGLTYTAIGIHPKDAQMLEARQFSRSDVASLFRVPLHKINDLTRATFSNIEQQSLEFVIDCVRPMAVNWERRVNMDLLDPLDPGDGNEYFFEFLIDGLLRGDQKSRYEAYATGIQNAILNPNTVRGFENLNPYAGGDAYYINAASVPVGQAGADAQDEGIELEDQTANASRMSLTRARSLYRAKLMLKEIVQSNAERVARKEVKALRNIIEKKADSGPQAVRAEIARFYSDHVQFVMDTMKIRRQTAEEYVSESRRAVETEASEFALGFLEHNAPRFLSDIAMREKQ